MSLSPVPIGPAGRSPGIPFPAPPTALRRFSTQPPPPPDGEPSRRPELRALGDGAGSGRDNRASEPRGSRWLRRLVIIVATVGALVFVASWSYASSSRNMCGSCHSVSAAAESAGDSVHADIPCLACHRQAGIVGAFTYLPVLLRESVHELTGLSIAEGVLDPVGCGSCHSFLSDAAARGDHPDETAECSSCHGNVAHPGAGTAPEGDGHPSGFFAFHGRDSVASPGSCAECHKNDFCSACHFRTEYPHPETWTSLHGPASIEGGPAACVMCHEPTYCSSCHGADIPHPDNWFEIHHRATDPAVGSACLSCHAASECSSCHVRHSVHNEQGLYQWDLKP